MRCCNRNLSYWSDDFFKWTVLVDQLYMPRYYSKNGDERLGLYCFTSSRFNNTFLSGITAFLERQFASADTRIIWRGFYSTRSIGAHLVGLAHNEFWNLHLVYASKTKIFNVKHKQFLTLKKAEWRHQSKTSWHLRRAQIHQDRQLTHDNWYL